MVRVQSAPWQGRFCTQTIIAPPEKLRGGLREGRQIDVSGESAIIRIVPVHRPQQFEDELAPPRCLSSNRRERAVRQNPRNVVDTGEADRGRCRQQNRRLELGRECSGSPRNTFPTGFSMGSRTQWLPKHQPEQISNWRKPRVRHGRSGRPSCAVVCRKEHRTQLSANDTANFGITAAVIVACL